MCFCNHSPSTLYFQPAFLIHNRNLSLNLTITCQCLKALDGLAIGLKQKWKQHTEVRANESQTVEEVATEPLRTAEASISTTRWFLSQEQTTFPRSTGTVYYTSDFWKFWSLLHHFNIYIIFYYQMWSFRSIPSWCDQEIIQHKYEPR